MGNTATQNEQIKILTEKYGIPISFINAHPELRDGKWIDPQDIKKYVNAWNASPEKIQQDESKKMSTIQSRIDNLPDTLKNDPSFQALSADEKEIVIYNYEVQKANDADKAAKLASALEQATAQSDPYFKEKIRIAQDELLRTFEADQGDYTSSLERTQRRIEEINQDLSRNKEYLSLEQQAELGSLAADLQDKYTTFQRNMEYLGAEKASQLQGAELNYQKAVDDINRNMEFTTAEKDAALKNLAQQFKIQQDNITQGAADAGLTFSTKKKIAETRLEEANQGMIESTQRTYNKQMADMQANQAYNTTQYGLQTGSIERQFGNQMSQEQQAYATAQRLTAEQRENLQRDYAKQIADLEVEASRGNVEAQSQIADLQRKLNESITQTGRTAETYLGSENMPTGTSYQAMGGVTGQLYEDQVKDIETRKNAIYGDLTQSSLTL